MYFKKLYGINYHTRPPISNNQHWLIENATETAPGQSNCKSRSKLRNHHHLVILSESEKIVGLQLNGLSVGLDSPISQYNKLYPETSFWALMYLMLSQDTTHLGGLGGAVLGSMITFTVTIVRGLLGLVCAALILITVGSGYVRLIILSLFGRKVPQAMPSRAREWRSAPTPNLNGMQRCHSAPSSRPRCCLPPPSCCSYPRVLWFSSIVTAGGVYSFAPDMSKAMQAKQHLRNLINRVLPIDSYTSARQRQLEMLQGVSFEMPTIL
ncbi:uncharacterized protein MCYG_07108 [Microsporum canis CBS 113480]|uniref:Uncharacterized protein n=1 Tax=Arthroderma otae (strain ATCC MYA-4605 / CBS 113480) TaxID=554155 RepID=C5FWK5_ARTOC|nr:uncharacterized protein MCYG_07108 [Microsporum canis CBS 113480]EEQ34289.1 hypothetical protein MCYG_07108 [Microsporum canis CBS 113480]